jgi:ribosome-associated heat shock protein Hsp15
VAQQLYEETPYSIPAREKAAEMRRMAPEPATTSQEGRPTKRARREIEKVRNGSDCGSRWSASIDE